jgi:pre-rRNA-processing protein TSR1
MFARVPKVVVLVALSDYALTRVQFVQRRLAEQASGNDKSLVYAVNKCTLIVRCERFRTRFCIVALSLRDFDSVLSVCQVADVVAFVMAPTLGEQSSSSSSSIQDDDNDDDDNVLDLSAIDEHGELLMSALKAQGLCSIANLVVMPNGDELQRCGRSVFGTKSGDQAATLLATCTKLMNYHFGADMHKSMSVDTDAHVDLVVRHLAELMPHEPRWRVDRSYMLVEHVQYDETTRTLAVCGHVRGAPMSANQVVVLPGAPLPHSVRRIDTVRADPYSKRVVGQSLADIGFGVLATPDEALQQDPAPAPPDLNFDDDLPDAVFSDDNSSDDEDEDDDIQESRVARKVPKGTSPYQASWIVDSDSDLGSDSDLSSDDDDVNPFESSASSSSKRKDKGSIFDDGAPSDDDFDIASDEDVPMDAEDKREERTLEEEIEDDLQFPDELDTPLDVPARVRFQRYRGLRSFRTSPWDPKENLPISYSRVSQFENFARAAKRVRQPLIGAVDDNAEASSSSLASVGQFVRVLLVDVDPTFARTWDLRRPLTVSALLRHETVTSVCHFHIRKHASYDEVVRAKDLLEFAVGFRSFELRPLLSQHSPNMTRNKYARFLHAGADVLATVFAPIMFAPANVVVFKRLEDGSRVLVATGSLNAVDPDRLVLKKVMLSGHPMKVNKRRAIVRRMFYSPDDIRWFQSLEVRTKYGRTGHIVEPLGTHGLMKCVFDGVLQQRDTVCLSLYKRVFPPWLPSSSYHSLKQQLHGNEDELDGNEDD